MLYVRNMKQNLKQILTYTLHRFHTAPLLWKKPPDPGIQLKEKNWQLEFHQIIPPSYGARKAHIYAKKPIKVKIVEGQTYRWCACGFSNTQPFCDYTHLNPLYKIRHRPLIFKAPETKEVWFCMCKMSKNPPFCDGTHRSKEVQDAVT